MPRPDIDSWALNLCEIVATRSKDPANKVGAVILRPDKSISSCGYNGFSKGVDDSKEIYLDKTRKNLRIVHAEMNALLFAKEDLTGYTIYVSPMIPCSQCTAAIIQSGITRIVAKIDPNRGSNWKDSFIESKQLIAESGIIFDSL